MSKKKETKKKLQTTISGKLEAALADLKTDVSEKRFAASVKKASKLLSGLLLPEKKEKVKQKVKEKKKTKKTKAPEETTQNTGQ